MVTTAMENEVIYDKKMSSVVPGRITGAEKVVRDLNNMDLAMKLHYITGVYLFDKDAAQGLRIRDLKRPMFNWLELYHPVAGRIRRAEDEDGRRRPFIKCNDSGVRIVEAKCTKTLREWLSSAGGSFDPLAYDHVLGPDLGFSPLVFVQFTWFKCGGISIGLSWSHILGDVFSATDFMNTWGKILANDQAPSMHLAIPCTERNGKTFSSLAKVPYSIKMVDPVGDHWQTTNNCRMQIHSFHFTAKHLNRLLSKASETSRDCNSLANLQMKPFEVISAVIWKSLAKIRAESEPKIVTICKKDSSSSRDISSVSLSNSQVISTVEAADLKVSDADLVELANLIAGKQEDERSLIEELIMESDHCQKGQSDYIIYGAKLTFVDLEGSKIYDLELNGHKPLFANYSLNGVGEEGAVVVLPTTTTIDYSNKEGERVVNLILPENLIEDLKNELRNEWSIF